MITNMQLQLMRIFGAAVALFLALLGTVLAQNSAPSDVLVFEQFGNTWVEGLLTPPRISNDGKWALFGRGADKRLYSLSTGREDPATLKGSFVSLSNAAFCGTGATTLARLGSRGTENGWFLPGRETDQLSTLPPGASPVCSPEGSEIAYFDLSAEAHELFLGARGNYRSVTGALLAVSFSPAGEMIYYLAFQPNGETSLSVIEVRTGKTQTIASRLDAGRYSQTVSADDKHAYVALASDGVPDNEARHNPKADRWLKIYEIDLSTGSRRRVVDSPGMDNSGPVVANGNLYWTRIVVHDSIVTIPVTGGAAKEVITGGQLPMWNPDGTKIGYFFGGSRVSDWALDLDDAVVSLDGNGNRTSEPSVIVSGYHEDFSPAWSPDGKCIAFHSHRSPTAVVEYLGDGSTDDVYLRKAADIHAQEIRLTDFGWETGPAYWSPDGKKLLFSSYKRGGEPGIYKLWVITVDTQKGAAVKSEMLQLTPEIHSTSWGAWSPDGKEIAVEDNRGAGKRSLWIVRADGSYPEKLLDYEGTTLDGVDWTHDGKTIIYSGLAGDRLQLFSVPRSGGAPRQLTHDSGNLMHPRVSPDGRRVACTRIVQSKQIWRRPLAGQSR